MELGNGCRSNGTAAMVTKVTVILQCFPRLQYCSKEYLGYAIIVQFEYSGKPYLVIMLYVQYKISLGNTARSSFLCFCFQSSTMFTNNDSYGKQSSLQQVLDVNKTTFQ